RAETVARDCTGCLVMPGPLQAHVHLCQTLFRGLGDDPRLEDWLARRIWPLEAAHTEETVYWSALLGAAELLLGGTTAILDMETVHHTGAAFEALDRSGIRATAGKCLMDAHPEGAPLGMGVHQTLPRRRTNAAPVQGLERRAGVVHRFHVEDRGRAAEQQLRRAKQGGPVHRLLHVPRRGRPDPSRQRILWPQVAPAA